MLAMLAFLSVSFFLIPSFIEDANAARGERHTITIENAEIIGSLSSPYTSATTLNFNIYGGSSNTAALAQLRVSLLAAAFERDQNVAVAESGRNIVITYSEHEAVSGTLNGTPVMEVGNLTMPTSYGNYRLHGFIDGTNRRYACFTHTSITGANACEQWNGGGYSNRPDNVQIAGNRITSSSVQRDVVFRFITLPTEKGPTSVALSSNISNAIHCFITNNRTQDISLNTGIARRINCAISNAVSHLAGRHIAADGINNDGDITYGNPRYVSVFPVNVSSTIGRSIDSCPSGWERVSFGSGSVVLGVQPRTDSNLNREANSGCRRVTAASSIENQPLTATFSLSQEVGVPTDLRLANDNDGTASDGIINNREDLEFTVTAQMGSTVQLYDGGTAISSASGVVSGSGSGTASVTISGVDIADRQGDHVITARSTLSGTTSSDSTSITVTLDSVAPIIRDLEITNDSDGTANDGIIKAPRTGRNFSVVSEIGLSVQLSDGSTALGSAVTVPGTGSGTATANFNNRTIGDVDGNHIITARVEDAAGNVSTTTFTVKLDRSVPSAPTAFSFDSDDDTGISDSDGITSTIEDLTFNVTVGSVADDEHVEILNGSTVIVRRVGPISGNVTFDVDINNEGLNSITARVIDLAGNTSTSAGPFELTIDTTVPAVPTLTLDPDSDTGRSNADNITKDTIPTFVATIASGDREDGLRVEFFRGSSSSPFDQGAKSVDNNGQARASNNVGTITSTKSYSAHSIDIAGNKSARSASLNVEFDSTVPTTTTNLDLSTSDDTCYERGNSGCLYGTKTDNKTSETSLEFSITASEERSDNSIDLKVFRYRCTVEPTLSNVGSSSCTDSGQEGIFIVGGLIGTISGFTEGTGGNHPYGAFVIEDVAGNQIIRSLQVEIDRTAPTAPDTPDLIAASDTGISDTDNLTRDTRPSFTATSSEANVFVTLITETSLGVPTGGSAFLEAAEDRGNSDIDSPNGEATIEIASNSALGEGERSIRVRSYDNVGNGSLNSPTFNIRVDTSTPEATFTIDASSDSGHSDSDRVTKDNTPTINLAGLESSTPPTGGTGNARIDIYNWVDDNSDGSIDENELSVLLLENDVEGIPDVTAATQPVTLKELNDGVYRVVIRQTDDAGNVTTTPVGKLNYNTSDGTKGSNVIIIDTVAPVAPELPDLSPASDSFGAYANPSRDGTDSDDITNIDVQTYFVIASDREAGAVEAATDYNLIKEQHQIISYDLDSADSATATATNLLPTLLPVDHDEDGGGDAGQVDDDGNVVKTANITAVNSQLIDDYDVFNEGRMAKGSLIRNDFNVPAFDINTFGGGFDGLKYVASKQVDLAGNISDFSSVYSVRIDNKIPQPVVTNDLTFHRAFDSGDVGDSQTSSIKLLFTITGLVSRSTASDLDYYVVKRVTLNNALVATTGYEYPSNDNLPEQTSGDATSELVSATCGENEARNDCTARVAALVSEGDGQYTNGVAIYIDNQNIDTFNTYYGYQSVSIDLAGNETTNLDQANVRILVPPPTPEQADLVTASDTTNPLYTIGDEDEDNITRATSWELTGRYGNGLTTDGTNETAEIDNNAAGGVTKVVFTIAPPSGSGLENHIIELEKTNDPNTSDVVVPSGADNPYTYTTTVDLASVYGNDLVDGDYTITTVAESSGERGSNSDALIVTLDTAAPTVGQGEEYTFIVNEYRKSSDKITEFRLDGPASGAFQVFDDESQTVLIQDVVTAGNRRAEYTRSTNLNLKTLNVIFHDAAGNTTERAVIDTDSLPPEVISYEVSPSPTTYVVNAVSRNERAITTQKYSVTTSGDACDEYTTQTSPENYNLLDDLSSSTTEKCIRSVSDVTGAVTVIDYVQDKVSLVHSPSLETADGVSNNTGRVKADFITSNTSPYLVAYTIPGSTFGTGASITYTLLGSTVTLPTDATTITEDGKIITRLTKADGSALVDGFYESLSITFSILGRNTTVTSPIDDRVTIDTAPLLPPTGIGFGTRDTLFVNSETFTVNIDSLYSGQSLFNNPAFLYHYEKFRAILLDGTTEIKREVFGGETTKTHTFSGINKGEGSHTFSVFTEDSAGNPSLLLTETVVVDITPPELTIVRIGGANNDVDTTGREYIAVVNDVNVADVTSQLAFYRLDPNTTCPTSGLDSAGAEQIFSATHTSTSTTLYDCYIVADAAGNFVAKSTSEAIDGIGNLQISGSTKEGSTYYISDGQKEVTGISASNAKVFLRVVTTDTLESDVVNGAEAVNDGENIIVDIANGETTFTTNIDFSSHNGKKIVGWIWTDKDDDSSETTVINLGTITIDNERPTISSISATSSNSNTAIAKSGDTITATVVTSEKIIKSIDEPNEGIQVTVAGSATACVPTEASGVWTHVCTVTLDQTAVESTGTTSEIVVTGTDLAGNTLRREGTINIKIDATAPSASSYNAPLLKAGITRTANIELTDASGIAGSTTPYTITYPGGSCSATVAVAVAPATQPKSVSFSCEYTTTGNINGAVNYNLPAISDSAGNSRAASSAPLYYLDIAAPKLSPPSGGSASVDISDRSAPTFEIQYAHGQTAAIVNLDEVLTVKFSGDGRCSSLSSSTTITGEPYDGTIKSKRVTINKPSSGTYENCVVNLVDSAGNESVVAGTSGEPINDDSQTSRDESIFELETFTIKKSGGGGGLSGGGTGSPSSSSNTPFFIVTRPDGSSTNTNTQIIEDAISSGKSRVPEKELGFGQASFDVKDLQESLNKVPECKVSDSGAGSAGRETTFYGPATRGAVICVQEKNGLPPTGQYDEDTMEALKKELGEQEDEGQRIERLKTMVQELIKRLNTLKRGNIFNSNPDNPVPDITPSNSQEEEPVVRFIPRAPSNEEDDTPVERENTNPRRNIFIPFGNPDNEAFSPLDN